MVAGLLASSVLSLAAGLQGLADIADTLVETTGAPGAAVARACGAGVQEGAAGVRTAGGAAPTRPGDLWHMGSNTKAMTATLAGRLVEQGVIDWSTRVGDALAALDVAIDPALAPATLGELLAHRAGVTPNAGLVTALRLSGANEDRDAPADRLVYARAVLGEAAGPRGAYLYSNAGYVIAAMMMETAAGAPYEALMAREVFAPLSMDSAGWGPPGEPGQADHPRGHRAGLFGRLDPREPGARADNPPALNPAGRVHLALSDLMDFLAAHRDRPEDYLSAATWSRLQTPVGEEGYALGWGVREDGSLVHAGSNTMWFARMLIDAESGCATAAALNASPEGVSDPVNDALEALTQR